MFPPDSPCVSTIRSSINFGKRAHGKPLDMLILHYTGMKTPEAALDWLCNPESGVSCHYFVQEDGHITQLVKEEHRAWHAGNSCWKGETDINSRSIGIEIVNPGHEFGYRDFPDIQIDAVIELCRDCVSRLQVPAQNVLAHSDIAPLRKEDPGERFPWQQLYKAGVGHWVAPGESDANRRRQHESSPEPVEVIQEMLEDYGYPVEITGITDELTQACIIAFQRHFRPIQVDGMADYSTIDTLDRLLKLRP